MININVMPNGLDYEVVAFLGAHDEGREVIIARALYESPHEGVERYYLYLYDNAGQNIRDFVCHTMLRNLDDLYAICHFVLVLRGMWNEDATQRQTYYSGEILDLFVKALEQNY